MFSLVYSKRVAIFILLVFCLFTLGYAYTGAGQDDNLEKKVRKFFNASDYEGAIDYLHNLIKEIKKIKKKKMELAEVYYYLAKTFYKVGLDDDVKVNLKEVYKAYPKFEKEELDLDFLKLAKNAQRDVKLEMKKVKAEKVVKDKPDVLTKTESKKKIKKKIEKPKEELKKTSEVKAAVKKPTTQKIDQKQDDGKKRGFSIVAKGGFGGPFKDFYDSWFEGSYTEDVNAGFSIGGEIFYRFSKLLAVGAGFLSTSAEEHSVYMEYGWIIDEWDRTRSDTAIYIAPRVYLSDSKNFSFLGQLDVGSFLDYNGVFINIGPVISFGSDIFRVIIHPGYTMIFEDSEDSFINVRFGLEISLTKK